MLMWGGDFVRPSVRPSVTAEGRHGRTDREGRRGPVALGAPRRMNNGAVDDRLVWPWRAKTCIFLEFLRY
jgi:hypothetical protein